MAIIGTDDRTLISNTMTMPNLAICRIISYFADGISLQSSGVLIGQNDVLVAGHALHQNTYGGYATSVQVMPGNTGQHRPLGILDASAFNVAEQWVQQQSYAHDYGLLALSSPIGITTGWASIASISQPSNYLDTAMYNLGYPGDLGGSHQYRVAGSPDTYEEGIYYFNDDLDAMGGQSGSPVMLSHQEYGELVVGLVSHENLSPTQNGAMVLSPQIAQAIDTWKQANDDQISHWPAQAEYADQAISLVANIYTIVLGRPAEEAGARNWLDHWQQGMSANEMVAHFLLSPEYLSKPKFANDNYSEFIQSLYQQCFQRLGDGGGTQYWLAQMQQGMSNTDVITAFIVSNELQQQQALANYQMKYQWFDSYQLQVMGRQESDILTASSLDDLLLGLAGDDQLYGGKGDDWLAGGSGNDQLRGGEGQDHFWLDNEDAAHDKILDFNPAEDVLAGKAHSGDFEVTDNGAGLVLTFAQHSNSIELVGLTASDSENIVLI